MGNAASPSHVSYEEYLALEESSEVRHEWCDGVVYAMSRGTPEHARLSVGIASALKRALGKTCTVYGAEAMLWIERANLSTYADVTVVCGPLRTNKVEKNNRSLGEAIVNPTILVEVLSESTERYDRDGKFQAYKQLPSFKEYVLVAQDERRIEVYRRGETAWTCETAGRGGKVKIHGRAVKVDDVYG